MKSLFFISLMPVFTFSQKIFTVNYVSQADIKVYVVDYVSQADLKVYKLSYVSQAKGNKGDWFFVKYNSQGMQKGRN